MKTKTLISGILPAILWCAVHLMIASAANAAPADDGTVSIYAAPGVSRVTARWAEEFNKIDPGRQVKLQGGTSGQIGFITSAESKALAVEPETKIVVGREVIVPVVNASNPFLQGIAETGVPASAFAASLAAPGGPQWGTLLNGGNATPVHYYIINDPGAIAIAGAFLGASVESSGTLKVAGTDEIASALRQDQYAVAFCRLTDVLSENTGELPGDLKFLPIDKNNNGRLDYMEQIYGSAQELVRGVWIGKYPKPLSAEIFSVAGSDIGETGTAFLAWVLNEGQQYLAADGFTELVAGERQSQLDKIADSAITALPAGTRASWTIYLLWGLAALLLIGLLTGLSERLFRVGKEGVRKAAAAVEAIFDEKSVRAPKGLYYDKTHTWAFMDQDGMVTAGIDDFLMHVTGPATRVEMKDPGDKIKKGDPFLTIIQQGKKLVVYSPVSGTIRSGNRDLIAQPSLLHTDPCREGWVYRIEPANWSRETEFMSMAEKYRTWLNGEFTRLKDFLASRFGAANPQYAHVVLQDGGALKDSLLEELGPEVWEDFQNRFLDPAR